MSKYVKPATVLSPRTRMSAVLEVIHDPGAGGMSVARILFDEEERLAVRWNGDDGDQPLGHPVSRRQPTWFVLADYVRDAVEEAAREEAAKSETGLAAGYREMAKDKDREREASEWTEGLIGDATGEAR